MRVTKVGRAAMALMMLWASPVQATQLEETDLREMSERAQVILVGQCTGVRARWNPKRTLISTYATYDVEEAIKGVAGRRQVVVKAMGGSVGHITQAVIDGPRFEVGSRDLLFLTDSDTPNTFKILGLSQGKLEIRRHPKTGEESVVGRVAFSEQPVSEPRGPAGAEMGGRRPESVPGPPREVLEQRGEGARPLQTRGVRPQSLKDIVETVRQHLEAPPRP